MMPGDLVKLRMDLEGMRMSMVTAMASRHDELQRLLQGAFDRAMEDVQGQIETWVRQETERQAKEMVTRAVLTAMWDAREALAEPIRAAVAKAVSETVK